MPNEFSKMCTVGTCIYSCEKFQATSVPCFNKMGVWKSKSWWGCMDLGFWFLGLMAAMILSGESRPIVGLLEAWLAVSLM